MANANPPKRGTALAFEMSLTSQASRPQFQNNPTLAAGDVLVSKDAGAFANVTDLPTAIASNQRVITVTLTATEMTADRVALLFRDTAGAEWDDLMIEIFTNARTFDDLAYPNTSGRGMDVDTSGGVEVGTFQAGAITAAAIANDAITFSKIASGAITATTFAPAALDAVWSTATRTLSAAGVQAIWDALTSALTTVGSIGKLLVDNVNATISSRLPTSSYVAPLNATQTESAVWDAVMASHLTGGSTGSALNGAGSAGDPWATAVPGAYGAGSAGNILGNNLNAQVSTRLPTSSYVAPLDAAGTRGAVGLANPNLDSQLDALPTAAENAAAVGTVLIETGLTLTQALQLIAAASGGEVSGADTNTIIFRNAVADSKNRITASLDGNGNRTSIIYDLT